MTWAAGLCSVTYRDLAPDEIIALASNAGLDAIEWGSDIHVPPGDVANAHRLGARCSDAGLACPTLGSYARATHSERSQAFEPLMDLALALGAKTIRVWAGETGFHATSPDMRQQIATEIHRYAEVAADQGLRVALEYHPNTLTDCRAGAQWLLDRAAHPALFSYWQPVPDQPIPSCKGDLTALGDRLAHVHVFHWKGAGTRHPLDQAIPYWTALLQAAAAPKGGHAFLEFVPHDQPGRLAAEATALRTCIDQAQAASEE